MSTKTTYRWLNNFYLANLLLLLILSSYFISAVPSVKFIWAVSIPEALFAWFFVLAAFVVTYAVLWLPILCVLYLLCALFKGAAWMRYLAVVLAALVASVVVLDSFVFHLFHFHAFGVVANILSQDAFHQVFLFSWVEYSLLAGMVLLLLLLQSVLAYWISRRLQKSSKKSQFKNIVAILLLLLFIVYYSMYSFTVLDRPDMRGNGVSYQVLREAQVIPLFERLIEKTLPHGSLHTNAQTADQWAIYPVGQNTHRLDYPKHPLHCVMPKHKYNMVFILADAMRWDMLNPTVAPNMYRFAQSAWQFKNHYSGGNATAPGIFSLFYGLPYQYWDAMRRYHQAPVLVKQFLRDGYETAIDRSSTLEFPAFNKTVFYGVPDLRLVTSGDIPYTRDLKITKEFLHFLKRRNTKKPFFGFLFYDSSHTFCQPGHFYSPFKPVLKTCDRLALTRHSKRAPYFNRYRNAVHFVDGQVGIVLRELKARHLLKNTIVILSADHGNEFNDNGLGYWGHTSDYTPYQLHVPFVVYWPGKLARNIHGWTSHYDVAPFLLRHVLGCTNPISDYSIGMPIMHTQSRKQLAESSYIDYAYLTPQHIVRIFPAGDYVVKTRDGFPLQSHDIQIKQLRQLWAWQNEFFKYSAVR